MIAKLNAIIMARYESYRTRRVPILLYPPNTSDANYAVYSKTFVYEAARARLDVLRDIMRMELPDHWSDITDAPLLNTYNPAFSSGVTTIGSLARPAVNQAYLNAYNSAAAPPSNGFQGAECLYLIVTLGTTDNLGGRELFSQDNIGDVDNDGFKEFLDGWGRPISFLRWPAGFPSELGRQASGSVASGGSSSITASGNLANVDGAYNGCAVLFTSGQLAGQAATVSTYTAASQTFNFVQTLSTSPAAGDTFNVMDPDPFDARHIYPTGVMPNGSPPSAPAAQSQATFTTYPLIYSGGGDRIYDILTAPAYDCTTTNNNPFFPPASTGSPAVYAMMGAPMDLANDSDPPNGIDNSKDNIHNHLLGTR